MALEEAEINRRLMVLNGVHSIRDSASIINIFLHNSKGVSYSLMNITLMNINGFIPWPRPRQNNESAIGT